MANEFQHVLKNQSNILTHENYEVWALKAEADLTYEGAWEAIDPGYDNVEEGDLTADQKGKNQKARAYLVRHISDDILEDIIGEARAKRMWNNLRTLHGDFSAVHVALLLKELRRIEKTDSMSMHEYTARVQNILAKLNRSGVAFTEHMKALFLITGLPLDRYGSLIKSINVQNDLVVQDIKNRLFLEERSTQLENRIETDGANALLARKGEQTTAATKIEPTQSANTARVCKVGDSFESSSMMPFKSPRSHWIASIKLVTRSRYLDHIIDIPFFSTLRPATGQLPELLAEKISDLITGMIIVDGKPPILTVSINMDLFNALKRENGVDALIKIGKEGASFVTTDLLNCDVRSTEHPEIINAHLVGTRFIRVPATKQFPVNWRTEYGKFLL